MKVGTDGVLLGAWAEGGSRILDIGAGTGLISLMMAQRFPEAQVVGIDIDADACQQARENAAASPFADRVVMECCALQELGVRSEELGVEGEKTPNSSLQTPNLIKDFRDAIRPKKPLPDPEFYPERYYQVYEQKHGFLPNMSILDLLFNEGNEAIFHL